jgi:hypothetical protein
MPRSTRRWRVAAAVGLLASLAFAVPGRAQSVDVTVPATPQPQPLPPARFDIAVSLSAFHLDAAGLAYAPGHGAIVTKGASYEQDVFGPDPPDTVAMLVSAGYYWNTHAETEVEVGWRARSDQYDTDPACPLIGGVIRCDLTAPQPVAFLMHNYEMRRVSLAQMYQFRRGTRFQPYIGAGMTLQLEREYESRIESPSGRTPPGAGPVGPGAGLPGPGSFQTAIGPFASVGFEQHLADRRVFVVTELRIGNPERWTFKLGLGVGF